MINWKESIRKILFPHTFIVFLMFNVTVPALIYALAGEDVLPVLQYFVYAFSTYTLAVTVLQVIGRVQQIRRWSHTNRHMHRYLTDTRLRFVISLNTGFGISVAFAVLKMIFGYVYQSYWLMSIGIYYIILSGLRFILLYRDRLSKREEKSAINRMHQLKSYRFCGCMMFGLNLAMSGMVFQMIWYKESYRYPGFLVFAFAAYAFYALTMAIINLIKYWNMDNPILTAAKKLSLATALMSVFALQSALLVQFGGGDERFQFIMNSLTGFAVCLAIFLLALNMIRGANREIKKMHDYIKEEE